MPRQGTIFLAYSGAIPAVYPLEAKTILEALIEPRGVVTSHFPSVGSILEATDVTGVVVCRLTPRATTRERRCKMNLYGQMLAAVKLKHPFAPRTPET